MSGKPDPLRSKSMWGNRKPKAQITVCLTPDLKQALEEKCKALGISKSDLFRKLVIKDLQEAKENKNRNS